MSVFLNSMHNSIVLHEDNHETMGSYTGGFTMNGILTAYGQWGPKYSWEFGY